MSYFLIIISLAIYTTTLSTNTWKRLITMPNPKVNQEKSWVFPYRMPSRLRTKDWKSVNKRIDD